MNPTDYANHPLRNLLDRLADLATSVELTDPDLLNSEPNASALSATFAVTSQVRRMFDRSQALMVSNHGLTQLQNAFQAVFNELAAYRSNKNHGHIHNAKAQMDESVMPHLWAFGPREYAGDSTQLVEVVNQATSVAHGAVQQLVGQRDALAANQKDLEQQIQDCQARVDGLTERLVKLKADAAAAVGALQLAQAEKDVERVTSFEAMLKEFRADFEKLQEESQQTQSERLTSLKKSQEQASQIVQVVGNIAVTGNYQKIAVNEGKQANFWRWITVSFFSAGVIIACATLVKFWNDHSLPKRRGLF